MTFQPPELQQPPRWEKPSAAEFTKPWRPSPWCTTWRRCTRPTAWRTRQKPSSITKTRAESTKHPVQMRYWLRLVAKQQFLAHSSVMFRANRNISALWHLFLSGCAHTCNPAPDLLLMSRFFIFSWVLKPAHDSFYNHFLQVQSGTGC